MQNPSPFTSSTASETLSTPPMIGPPSELGVLRGEHRCSMISTILVGVLVLLVAVGIAWAAYESRDLTFAAGSLAAAVGGAALIAYGFKQRCRAVRVYEHGVSFQSSAATIESARWDEIETIVQQITKHYHNGIYTGTTHVYTVKVRGKKPWKWNDSFKEVAKLGEVVQNAVAQIQLPRVVADFQAGRPVAFGGLVFDAAGISYNKKNVPWSEFKGIDIKGGYVRIHKPKEGVKGLLTGGTIVVPVAGLPNFYTLAIFLRYLPPGI